MVGLRKDKTMQTYTDRYYRPLNAAERQLQIETINWLLKKKLTLAQIKTLTYRVVEPKRETIRIRYDTRIGTFERHLPYRDTPLDVQITMARESSKSSLFLLPKRAWKGRRPTYCPAYREEEIRELIGQKKTWKILWTKA